jgi:hypothetical protein
MSEVRFSLLPGEAQDEDSEMNSHRIPETIAFVRRASRQARVALLLIALSAFVLAMTPAGRAQGAKGTDAPAANLAVAVAVSQAPADALLDPDAAGWQQVAGKGIALNRTPPLYDTDPPATLEIPQVDVRLARAGGKLLVRLAWRDGTQDTATIAKPPATPPEDRRMKEHSEASNRFFDAAAVMFPANLSTGVASPSLQMGDAKDPVTIYYWNAARGTMLMKAAGRGTTQRTGESFPARSAYQNGGWRLTLELPDMPAGVPLAFAIWNGRQQDRDGRKAFSVWYRLQ